MVSHRMQIKKYRNYGYILLSVSRCFMITSVIKVHRPLQRQKLPLFTVALLKKKITVAVGFGPHFCGTEEESPLGKATPRGQLPQTCCSLWQRLFGWNGRTPVSTYFLVTKRREHVNRSRFGIRNELEFWQISVWLLINALVLFKALCNWWELIIAEEHNQLGFWEYLNYSLQEKLLRSCCAPIFAWGCRCHFFIKPALYELRGGNWNFTNLCFCTSQWSGFSWDQKMSFWNLSTFFF